MSGNLRHGAMKPRIENRKVWHSRKQAQSLAHDVHGDGCVKWREGGVALDFVDQLRRNALVFFNGGAAGNDPMADRPGSRQVGVEGVGHKLEGNRAVGQRGGLIDELFSAFILDPELALVGPDAVDRPFKEALPAIADRFIN